MTFDHHAETLATVKNKEADIRQKESQGTSDAAEGQRKNLLLADSHPSWPSILTRDIAANQANRPNVEALRNRWAAPDAFRDQELSVRFAEQDDQGSQRQLAAIEQWFDAVIAKTPTTELTPAGGFLVRFRFTLHSPYLSKDDVGLHILDNPIRRERVFGFPFVAASSWKGALRAALRDTCGWKEADAQGRASPELVALCGSPGAGPDYPGYEGCFRCFPTFFKRTGVEMINPHDRTSGAGTVPIRIESVPAGQTGEFALVYMPRLHAREPDISDDFNALTNALFTLFILQGFGAKTSSGFGRAKDEVTGSVLRGADHHDFTALSELKGMTLQ